MPGSVIHVARHQVECMAEARKLGLPLTTRDVVSVEMVLSGRLRGRTISGFTMTDHAWEYPRILEALTMLSCMRIGTTMASKNVGVLFIGGPKHGERMAVRGDSGNSVHVAHMLDRDPRTMHYTYGAQLYPDTTMGYNTSVYTRQRIGIGGATSRRSLEIMVHESISNHNASEVALDILFTEAGGVVN